MRKSNKKGFTIVELVIVIAVIAILAGVLIPVFSGVIGNANKSAAMQEMNSEWKTYYAKIAADYNGTTDYVVVYNKGGNNNEYYAMLVVNGSPITNNDYIAKGTTCTYNGSSQSTNTNAMYVLYNAAKGKTVETAGGKVTLSSTNTYYNYANTDLTQNMEGGNSLIAIYQFNNSIG